MNCVDRNEIIAKQAFLRASNSTGSTILALALDVLAKLLRHMHVDGQGIRACQDTISRSSAKGTARMLWGATPNRTSAESSG